jgi:hypothetical protein
MSDSLFALTRSHALQVYEEVQAEAYVELPYASTNDQLWHKAGVLSWRWAKSKPSELQPGFSPMQPEQFAELHQLLRMAQAAGLEYIWIDWWVPAHLQA